MTQAEEKSYISESAMKIWNGRLKGRLSADDTVGIIGGNCLLTLDNKKENYQSGKNYKVKFEFQRFAFEIALELADIINKESGAKATITVIIDQGDDIRNFLGIEEKRKPNGTVVTNCKGETLWKPVAPKKSKGHSLSHFHPEVLNHFQPALDKYRVAAKEVRILFEIQCRVKIKDLYNWNKNNPDFDPVIFNSLVKDKMCTIDTDQDQEDGTGIGIKTNKVASCKGITGNCLNKTAEYASRGKPAKFCVGVWGKDPLRSDPVVIEGGSQIARHIFLPKTEVLNAYLSRQEDRYQHDVTIGALEYAVD